LILDQLQVPLLVVLVYMGIVAIMSLIALQQTTLMNNAQQIYMLFNAHKDVVNNVVKLAAKLHHAVLYATVISFTK